MDQEPKVLTLPVQWDKVTFPKTRANCGVLTLVTTKEVVAKEERDVLRHLCDDDEIGHMLFVRNGADAAKVQIPKEPAPAPGRKSQALRIRGVLAVEYQTLGKPYGSHDAGYERYYQEQTELFIQERKANLPPRNGGY
jgi:hypothetical protein